MPDVLFNRLCQHQQCVFLEFLGTLCYVSTYIVLKVYYTHYICIFRQNGVYCIHTTMKNVLREPRLQKKTRSFSYGKKKIQMFCLAVFWQTCKCGSARVMSTYLMYMSNV